MYTQYSINNAHMRSVCTCRKRANVSKFGPILRTGSTCTESLIITPHYHTTGYNKHTKEGAYTFVRITQLCI